MLWTKGAKFQAFNCSREISPNLYFDRFLLLKEFTISVKRVQRTYVSWHRRVKENLKNLKICLLIGPFRVKNITFDQKKYRGVIFHDTKKSWKIWRKTGLWSWKWHEEFCNFSQERLKSQNWDFDGILLSKVENVWA